MAKKRIKLPPSEEANPTPNEHPLWPAFVAHANKEGIGLKHKEDWWAWWQCFLAGAEAQYENLKDSIDGG